MCIVARGILQHFPYTDIFETRGTCIFMNGYQLLQQGGQRELQTTVMHHNSDAWSHCVHCQTTRGQAGKVHLDAFSG